MFINQNILFVCIMYLLTAEGIVCGSNIEDNQKKFINILTLQLHRLGMKEIRAKLATLQEYFPYVEAGHRIVALEGQMMIPEPWLEGRETISIKDISPGYIDYDQWMLFYGIKADLI